MATVEIEVRVSALESEVDSLKRELQEIKRAEKPWWEKIAGRFADDPTYEEAMRLGREYREAQREDFDDEKDV